MIDNYLIVTVNVPIQLFSETHGVTNFSADGSIASASQM